MEYPGEHARTTFETIQQEGPSSRPIDFPTPRVRRGVRGNALVVHPDTGMRDVLSGVIHREEYRHTPAAPSNRALVPNTSSESSSVDRSSSVGDHNTSPTRTTTNVDTNEDGSVVTGQEQRSSSSSSGNRRTGKSEECCAYYPQRRLQDAIYGSVWCCLVLRQHFGPAADDAAQAAGVEPGDPSAPIVWEISGRFVAIKMVEWRRVQQSRGRLLEDPIKEIAAMQLIGTRHPNVLGSLEVLQDTEYLYSVLPYARGGDLFGYVINQSRGDEGGMPEPTARFWFRQILQGVHYLQSMGICHRDLSLENILVDDENCLIIDFGMCLRVPYTSRSNPNATTDVSHGTTRRLIRPQGTCGKHNYMAPEIYANREDFDGFAIDLWSVGVILYIMLTGFPPYDHASLTDERFHVIADGRLMSQLMLWDIHLSEEAGQLLQNMLNLVPNERLTLAEVMEHPWVTNPEVTPPPREEGLPF